MANGRVKYQNVSRIKVQRDIALLLFQQHHHDPGGDSGNDGANLWQRAVDVDPSVFGWVDRSQYGHFPWHWWGASYPLEAFSKCES